MIDQVLVWAVYSTTEAFGMQIEAIYMTFDEAHEARNRLQAVWPDRQFLLQVTFLHNPSL